MFSPVSSTRPAWSCQADTPAGVDHAQQIAAVEDVCDQSTVQLGFRDSYPSKHGYYPFSDGPTGPLPVGVVAEISRLHSKQGTALPWDIPPIDRAGLDACQFKQLLSQAVGMINRYAHATEYQGLYPEAHDMADRLYRYASRRWGIHAFSAKQCLRPAEAALDYTYIPGNEPSEEGFREWQRENGVASGRVRRGRCAERDIFIIDADAAGDDGVSIARACAVRWPHLGHSPSTVSRVLARDRVARLARTINDPRDDFNNLNVNLEINSSLVTREGSHNGDPAQGEPVAEASPQHWILSCWYANVGAYLSAKQADRLVEFADLLEAEELARTDLPNSQDLLWLVDEVIIRRCSEAGHPAAYLMACIDHHRQPLPAEKVQKAVQSVGFEFSRKVQYVAAADNPVAYLTVMSRNPDANAGLAGASPMGVGLNALKRWATGLVTPTFEAEARDLMDRERSGHVESYRRRFGRLPWDNPPDAETPETPANTEVVPSPAVKRPVEPEKLEHPENRVISGVSRDTRPDPSPGEVHKAVERYSGSCENARETAKLEHAPCRHRLALMLATTMSLDAIERVDCSEAGCSCMLYSDRGRIPCPCHWSTAKTVAVGRALQVQPTGAGNR